MLQRQLEGSLNTTASWRKAGEADVHRLMQDFASRWEPMIPAEALKFADKKSVGVLSFTQASNLRMGC